MPQELTIYEKAVTTDRSAELLAKRHGFVSLSMLAESLPANAHVLDVGAGASPLGKEVAALRTDITWVNFDYSYRDPTILEEVTKDAPKNVEHVAGDATKLTEFYKSDTFDAVFSYWLLPHLSLDHPEPAQDAAKAIYTVTKPDGLISVGPVASKKRIPSLKSGVALQFTKNSILDAKSFADQIVTITKLPKVGHFIQKMANEVATPFFGTTRYSKRDGKIPKLYHRESGEYVSPFTRKGAKTSYKLAVAMARYANGARKSKKSRSK